MKSFLNIKIEPASNGIIVKVGCVLLVYQQTQLNMFHNDLVDYLDDPIATEKEIRKRWHIEQGVDEVSPEERPTPSRTREAEPTEERDTAEKAPR